MQARALPRRIVEFASADDLDYAVQKLDGSRLDGCTILVYKERDGPPPPGRDGPPPPPRPRFHEDRQGGDGRGGYGGRDDYRRDDRGRDDFRRDDRDDDRYDRRRGDDRGYDRGNDRGYDRGDDRGYDRGGDRGYGGRDERADDRRGRFDRD